MARDFMIDDRDLTNYITSLTVVPRKVGTRSARWVRKMTRFTERKMKQFSKSKSIRSTGKLSSSISSQYTLTNKYIEGMVFVPSDIKYQFAAEHGIRRRFKIYGQPKMTFPSEHWKKAKRLTVGMPHRGYFVFTQVTRGKYRGRRYTEKSFKSLKQYYSRNESKILEDIGRTVLFAR